MGQPVRPRWETGALCGGLSASPRHRNYLNIPFSMKHHPTPEALALKEAIEGYGLRVLTELGDGHKHIDLAIPDAHINIEVDGSQHLANADQILRDLAREHYSDLLGYDTIHVPNQAIRDNLGHVARAIAEAALIRIGSKKTKPHGKRF